MTPDTESEQPTDTEVSESKTISSSTSEKQVSTPEEESVEEVTNIVDEESVPVADVSYGIDILDLNSRYCVITHGNEIFVITGSFRN